MELLQIRTGGDRNFGYLLLDGGEAAILDPGEDPTQLLRALDATPLLDFGMRLGEGSGAAVAVPLLQSACRLHNEMATFAEAGVSTGEPH